MILRGLEKLKKKMKNCACPTEREKAGKLKQKLRENGKRCQEVERKKALKKKKEARKKAKKAKARVKKAGMKKPGSRK